MHDHLDPNQPYHGEVTLPPADPDTPVSFCPICEDTHASDDCLVLASLVAKGLVIRHDTADGARYEPTPIGYKVARATKAGDN